MQSDFFQLRAEHTREVLDYLMRDPVESVFLRGLILRIGIVLGNHRGRFVGIRDRAGQLSGVMLLSPLVVPFATVPGVATAMGDEVTRSGIPTRNIVGRREIVQELWAGMGAGRPRPRLIRDRQPVYCIARAEFRTLGSAADMRRATLRDLDVVVESGAAMMREEVEEDPLAERPDEYRHFVRDRVLRGDEYVWIDENGLCFKCNVSSRTPDIAQIEGVFTPPARRRRGFASRGLSTLCARLLRDVPRLCLYVNDFNAGAIKLYERLGFKSTFDYQSIFFPPD
jgi:ribosomal protein S18 acetylase RimI-like enzyme